VPSPTPCTLSLSLSLSQDGCLSCQDLARLCGDLGCELSGEELNAAMNILDSDRDGKVLSRFVAQ
jgi:Ca2+-binding EF-hand superfamily protein